MVNDKDKKRITVRVSPALYQKVVFAASERNLTINAFIIQALESVVQEDPKQILTDILERLKDIESKLPPD